MRTAVRIGLAATSVLALAGCAGIPAAVTVASLYVDSILVLRTGKGSTEHIVSAAAGQDCGVMNLFQHGSICIDGPPQQLLVELMREVGNLPPNSQSTAEATATVQLASLPSPVLSDSQPAPGAEREAGPPLRLVATASGTSSTVASQVARPAPTAARPAAAAQSVERTARADSSALRPAPVRPAPVRPTLVSAAVPAAEPAARRTSLLVVVGSFLDRAQAERHRDRLGRPDADIMEATVFGRLHHRVVLRPADRDGALRELHLARAGGIPDAWLLADPRGHRPEGTIAMLAARMFGALL